MGFMNLRNQLSLMLIGTIWFCGSAASADVITERMVWEKVMEVAKAHCAAEWREVQAVPVKGIDYDALQGVVDSRTDDPIEFEEDYPWPFPEIDHRASAYIVVVAADVGLLVSLLVKARAYDEDDLTLGELRHYAQGAQKRLAFQECLKLSPDENIEVYGNPQGVVEMGQGVC